MSDPIGIQNHEYKTACGGKLKDPTNYPGAIYQNKEIYFCTLECFRTFETNPDRFIAGEIKHAIHEE